MIETTRLAPPADARFERSADDQTDQIDLREYLWALRRFRVVIVVGMLAGGGVIAWTAMNARDMYSAEVTVTVSQSKLDVGIPGGPVTPLVTTSFRSFLESRNVAARLIQELKLNQPPYNLSATGLFGSAVTIEEVRGSTVLLVRAQLPDPGMAARVANRMAEIAVETGRRVSQQEALQSQEGIKVQLDAAQTRMEQAETALSQFRNESQVELLRKDVEALLNKRLTLLPLLVEIESERAKVARGQQELAARQRIDTIKRSIDTDPGMMEAARKVVGQTGDRPAGDLLGLQMRTEFLNPVYQTIDEQMAKSQATLAGLEREKQQVVDVRKLDAPQSPELTRLYRVEAELSKLEMERDLARKVYLGAATTYETARVQVAGRSPQLQIIEPALPADRPESRHVARQAVIGMITGLVLSVMAVLVFQAIATYVRA